jgi:formyltetrahydrofolate-dependent phosphoribosylglycinamide formyltransferase
MRLSVLVSGRGSNLRELVHAIEQGRCPAQISCVLSDREGAPALEFARERGIRTEVVRAKDYTDRGAWDAALASALAAQQPELVVLAGFMRIVGSAVLARFENRLVNVHPSLLPAFPGMDASAQAIAKGVSLSGCTVHLVDGGVDSGPILAQAAVPVLPSDDALSLHARIQRAEHQLLPAVIAAIAQGKLLPGLRPQLRAGLAALPDAFVWPRFSD